MAWSIIKTSFAVILSDIKKYLPMFFTFIVITALSIIAQLSGVRFAFLIPALVGVLDCLFVAVPCISVYHKKSPYSSTVRAIPLAIFIGLLNGGIYFAATFLPQHPAVDFGLKFLPLLLLAPLSVIMIHLAADKSSLGNALKGSGEFFKNNLAKLLWLNIKILLIEYLLVFAAFTAITIILAFTAPAVIKSTVCVMIISALLSAVITLMQYVIYCICFYTLKDASDKKKIIHRKRRR